MFGKILKPLWYWLFILLILRCTWCYFKRKKKYRNTTQTGEILSKSPEKNPLKLQSIQFWVYSICVSYFVWTKGPCQHCSSLFWTNRLQDSFMCHNITVILVTSAKSSCKISGDTEIWNNTKIWRFCTLVLAILIKNKQRIFLVYLPT